MLPEIIGHYLDPVLLEPGLYAAEHFTHWVRTREEGVYTFDRCVFERSYRKLLMSHHQGVVCFAPTPLLNEHYDVHHVPYQLPTIIEENRPTQHLHIDVNPRGDEVSITGCTFI